MNEWKKLTAALVMGGVLFGCSNKETELNGQTAAPGGAGLTEYTMVGKTSSLSQYEAGKTVRTNLVEVPVDASFNAQVFISNDQTDPANKNAAFIAPKLFAYGTQQGGQVVVKKHPNGNVTISFNIAFVDGRSTVFSDPKSYNKINVPYAYLVHDSKALETTLRNQYQVNPSKIGALSGCPELVLINYAGREYDVTPSRFKNGNSCATDPFTVSMTVSKEDAKDILYNQLPNGTIDVGAVYATKTAIPQFNVSIEFSKRKMYESLYAAFKMNWAVDVDASLEMTKIVTERAMRVSIQGNVKADYQQMIQSMVSQASTLFFKPMAADPARPETKKCEKIACIQLNGAVLNESDNLTLSFAVQSNDMIGYRYISSTKLKSTNKSVVTLGMDEACKDNCDRLTSDGKPLSTGFIIRKNTAIFLKQELILKKTHVGSVRKVHEDHEYCQVPFLHAAGLTVNQCNRRYGIPDGSTGKTICNSCFSGYSNQWIDRTIYDNEFKTVKQPSGLFNVFDMSLVFGVESKDDQTQKMECPLSAFKYDIRADVITIYLGEENGCAPFKNLKSDRLSLSIIDRDHYMEETFECGNDVINWAGVQSETHYTQKFKGSRETVLTVGIDEDDPYGLR